MLNKKWNDMRYPTLKRTLFGTTKCFQFADEGQSGGEKVAGMTERNRLMHVMPK